MPSKITVNKNDPLLIEGEFSICYPQGNIYSLAGRTLISLCRCGISANQPFCDGSHNQVGFQLELVTNDLPPPKL